MGVDVVMLPRGGSCPKCGWRTPSSSPSHGAAAVASDLSPEALQRQPVPKPPPGTTQYRVITQRDEFFESKFNPESLEALINMHAAEGWRVVSMTATDVGSFWGTFWAKGGGAARQELVVLLDGGGVAVA